MHKDFTYCHHRGCLLSETCIRAKKPESEDAWFFSDEPFKYIDGKFDCAMYVGVNQINIFEQAKDNMDGSEANNSGSSKGADNGGIEETK
jgi:hypothetical protein